MSLESEQTTPDLSILADEDQSRADLTLIKGKALVTVGNSSNRIRMFFCVDDAGNVVMSSMANHPYDLPETAEPTEENEE